MKKNKYKQMICIEWVDASISSNEQLSQKEAEQEELIHGFVFGVLVKEYKDRYVVARDWFDLYNEYRGVASYPKSGVVSVKKYDLAEGKPL